MRVLISGAVLALACVLLGACSSGGSSGSSDRSATFYGAAQELGDGSVRSYVALGADGQPLAMGLRLTAAALSGLPADMAETVVPLPVQGPPPFDHVTVDWNPMGHEPAGVYDLPHFDFHFYLMTQAQLEKITSSGEGMMMMYQSPDTAEVPAGFAGMPNANGVPRMGWHWLDPASPELNGGTFTCTFIHGFYAGHLNFFEPMITKAFLESKAPLAKSFSRPALYPKAGYYPDGYSVSYDAATDEYVISLTGLAHN
jgi:hypothetical protein